ncbi:hypothetical protein WN944_014581 [Citrus x changshan-huyou]|uniref:Uncharacterized protein n=1 Tax=Citrus x changshan-huyou TaxID=2935761 RepID=A0AAP0MAU7_9ROSI
MAVCRHSKQAHGYTRPFQASQRPFQGLFKQEDGPRSGTAVLVHHRATSNFTASCCRGYCGFMMPGEDEASRRWR